MNIEPGQKPATQGAILAQFWACALGLSLMPDPVDWLSIATPKGRKANPGACNRSGAAWGKIPDTMLRTVPG